MLMTCFQHFQHTGEDKGHKIRYIELIGKELQLGMRCQADEWSFVSASTIQVEVGKQKDLSLNLVCMTCANAWVDVGDAVDRVSICLETWDWSENW